MAEKTSATTAAPPGLPTLRGVEHIGFTVPDIEVATRFFVEVIGCRYVYSIPPIADQSGTWMADHLNVHPRAVAKSIRFFRCGNGSNFEVFEYAAPEQATQPPRNSDIGGHHLAFYVDDFNAAIQHLRKHSVRILGRPTVRTEGPNAGLTWVYFLSPWDMQLELVSFPNGKGYERLTSERLWHPGLPIAT